MERRYSPMIHLKLKRIEHGMTQKELAEKAGVSQNVLSCYEIGTAFPRRKTLNALAEALECDVNDII